MRWTFTQKTFHGGVLHHAGEEVEASVANPPPHAVASHLYKPVEPEVVPVPTPGGFVVRGEDGKLLPAGQATRLVGRSPHELRPFARD